MPQPASRSARIEARIAPDSLAVVRRAAEIEGRSMSEFVVAAACDAARKTIEAAQIIRLSLADQERVAAILAEPGTSTSALERAIAAHHALIHDGG